MMSRGRMSRGMVKELGRRKKSYEDRVLERRMRAIERSAKYHKKERQLVLWSYPKMLLVKAVMPWKWRLEYHAGTRSGATGWQMTLTEKGRGERKKDGRAYREVLHRSESRILQLEMGAMAHSADLMGKGLHKNPAVIITVRKRRT